MHAETVPATEAVATADHDAAAPAGHPPAAAAGHGVADADPNGARRERHARGRGAGEHARGRPGRVGCDRVRRPRGILRRTTPEPEVAVAAEAEWEDTQKTGPSEAPKSADPRTTVEYADRSEETLRDHLLWQLELENLDARTTAIGQAVIDAINDDGYLTDDLETIRATLAPDVLVSIEDIEQVLVKLVQQFDPAGVGARSVSECVQLQLGQLVAETPGLELAKRIAAEHLPLVAEHQYGVLKRLLRASDGEIEAAIALVRACQPRPGANVFTAPPEYVVPDVFVRRHEGQWVVELNNSMSPQLRVNQLYAGSLGRGEEYDALKAQLQEARWLIRSLEIRNETLLKVALTIVQRQTEFLEQGEEHMRPMVLRDVAEAIEMHESTVSRVTTNKYMHTPRGVFEFRYFFSSHVAGEEGDQSSTAVRAKIRKLVERRGSREAALATVRSRKCCPKAESPSRGARSPSIAKQ